MRSKLRTTWLLSALSVVACGDALSWVVDRELAQCWPGCEGDAREDAGVAAASTWGAYAASLDIPPCPSTANPPLIVDTEANELDGDLTGGDLAEAGPRLSLTEAVLLSHYRAGPDTILFDAERFPAERPATIRLGNHPLPSVNDLCMDARDRGVIVTWDEVTTVGCSDNDCMWMLGPGSMMVGMTLTHTSGSMSVHSATVAACRIASDGTQAIPGPVFTVMQLFDATEFGPGNSVGHRVQVFGGLQSPHIHGNSFGYDPVTRQQISGRPLLLLDLRPWDAAPGLAEMVVEHNLIGMGISIGLTPTSIYPMLLRYNRIGVDLDGEVLPGQLYGFNFHSNAQAWVGPGNIVRGVDNAVYVGSSRARVKVLDNSIYDNASGIVFSGQAPLSPPTVDEVNALGGGSYRVSGHCTVPGLVELCQDRGDQCERPVAQLACEASAGLQWSGEVTLTPGWNLTATLSGELDTSAYAAPVLIP